MYIDQTWEQAMYEDDAEDASRYEELNFEIRRDRILDQYPREDPAEVG